MSGKGPRVSPDRKEWVRLSVQRPVLYAEDKAEIARKYGQGVKARIRKYKGQNGWEKRLCVRVPYDCSEQVVREARTRAIGLIADNAICGCPKSERYPWRMRYIAMAGG